MALKIVTTRELAHLLDVTPKTIAAWAAAGIVKRVSRGKFDLAGSTRGFARHMRETAKARGGETAAAQVSAARVRLLTAQATRAETENAKLGGGLVDLAEFKAELEASYRVLSRGVMNIANILAARCSFLSREQLYEVDESLRQAIADFVAAYPARLKAELADSRQTEGSEK